MHKIHRGDCLEVMRTMPDNSVDLIATDPPYFKVKGEDWDRQWDKPEKFLEWMGELCDQWHRLLKPNGSLYVFASPKMARRVGNTIAEHFNILMDIRWRKPPFSTKAEMFRKEDLRCYFPASETIWFAEHYGADNIAKGEAGYNAKCDELRGFVFEPLRAYLDGERERAGFTPKECNAVCDNQMAGHYFSRVQWALPTEANYNKLREAFNSKGGEYLRRDYEYLRRDYEDLRRDYEDLRQEYEELRRPFSVTADVPYTDVWDFPTVGTYKGKHVCEKPLPLMEHIITASSRPGAVVLDSFMGSGSTAVAALRHGREFIGIEKDAHWCEQAERRINVETSDLFVA